MDVSVDCWADGDPEPWWFELACSPGVDMAAMEACR